MSDPKKRARYDEYGDDGDGNCFKTDEFLEAYDFYRSMHPEITKKDYKSFAERYRNSLEEATDLIEFYEEQNGNITKIMEFIMCSTNDDAPRFIEFFEQKIKIGELEEYPSFKKSKGKIEMLACEKAESKDEKEKLKKKKGSENNELEKMILAKR